MTTYRYRLLECEKLLTELHQLVRQGLSDSPEADLIRDKLDEHWYKMSEKEQKLISQFSEALYEITGE